MNCKENRKLFPVVRNPEVIDTNTCKVPTIEKRTAKVVAKNVVLAKKMDHFR